MSEQRFTRTEVISLMLTEDLAQETAVALYEASWWKSFGLQESAVLQLHQDRLCMPINKFKEALSFAFGRTIFSHELRDPDRLKAELSSLKKAPTFQEVLDMIPLEKRVVVEFDQQDH